ncbi:MAG: hypothetical protein HRT73_11035 [Flavobacteriales bacterium]|nr:hypothetical protein [Flavobacteriales bacterium]
MKVKTETKIFLYNVMMLLLGIMLLSIYIWFRFIRVRLPKDIPFNLSFIGFILLVYICYLLAFVIASLIVKQKFELQLITYILNFIYKPLIFVDKVVKDMTQKYYQKFLDFLVKNLSKITESTFVLYVIYFVFEILPRVLLLCALLIDVFWFYRLFYFYKMLYVVIILLITKYLVYSLNLAKETYIEYLELRVENILTDYKPSVEEDPEYDPEFMYQVSLKKLIEIQVNAKIFGETPYWYSPLIVTRYKKEELQLFELIEKVCTISLILDYQELLGNIKIFRYLKIVIFTLFFICWFYILLVSLPTLDISLIGDSFKYICEPFSQMRLF